MIAVVQPGTCSGKVKIPPSKSMSHRAIICAALANGKSRIDNVAYSKDILTTIDGMRALGAHIDTFDDYVEVIGTTSITQAEALSVFCCESGSTLRFFIPIFSLCKQPVTFTGQGRLMARPQKIYADLFHEKGLSFEQNDDQIVIHGALQSGDYTLDGDVSSQFISGLLFTLPLCDGTSTIHIKPPFESRSYVDLTLQMLAYFGVEAFFEDDLTIKIKGNQSYQARNYTIEGDYSQMAFFACMAAMNQDLDITGINHDSLQGDKEILEILKSANVSIHEIEHGYHIAKSDVMGCEIDLANCPDLGPILCVLGAFAKGRTHIFNAGRLRIKESDRIEAMQKELRTLGVSITSNDDEIFIDGASTYQGGAKLHGHNDHRIVMSLAVTTTLCKQANQIDDAHAIEKSYPQFYDDMRVCGIEVAIHE